MAKATTKKNSELPNDNSAKRKALDTALQQIEKSMGKGAVMRLSLIHI